MKDYIDAFALPIPLRNLSEYQLVAESVARIWKEHGALAYHEYVGDDLSLAGTRAFPEAINAKDGEAIIFGWVVFDSRRSRDLANERVATDPRMEELLAPLLNPDNVIFDAKRMLYGGFKPLVKH